MAAVKLAELLLRLISPPATDADTLCDRKTILEAFPLSPPTRHADIPAEPYIDPAARNLTTGMGGNEFTAAVRVATVVNARGSTPAASLAFLEKFVPKKLSDVAAEVARLKAVAVPERDVVVVKTGAAGLGCVVLVDCPATAAHLRLLKAYQTTVRALVAEIPPTKWSEANHVIGPGATGPGAVFFFFSSGAADTPEMAHWVSVVESHARRNAHRCCNYDVVRPFTALAKCIRSDCANLQCAVCAAEDPRCLPCLDMCREP